MKIIDKLFRRKRTSVRGDLTIKTYPLPEDKPEVIVSLAAINEAGEVIGVAYAVMEVAVGINFVEGLSLDESRKAFRDLTKALSNQVWAKGIDTMVIQQHHAKDYGAERWMNYMGWKKIPHMFRKSTSQEGLS